MLNQYYINPIYQMEANTLEVGISCIKNKITLGLSFSPSIAFILVNYKNKTLIL